MIKCLLTVPKIITKQSTLYNIIDYFIDEIIEKKTETLTTSTAPNHYIVQWTITFVCRNCFRLSPTVNYKTYHLTIINIII